MLSRWKIVSPLDFQQYNHFKYAICACMLVLEWKERAFIEKVNLGCFCWFPEAILVHKHGTPIWRLYTKLYKGAWNVWANNSETVGHKDLRLGQIVYVLVFYNIHFLGFFSWTVSNLYIFLRDSENDLYYYDQLAFSTKCISVTLDLQINSAVLLWDSIITLLISRWRGGTGQRKFSSTGGSRVVADARFVAPFLATRLTYSGSPRIFPPRLKHCLLCLWLIYACRVTKKVFFVQIICITATVSVASHPNVLRRSSRVPTPRTKRL